MEFQKFGSGPANIIFLHGWGAGKSSFLWLKEYLTNASLHFASLDGFDGTKPPKDASIAGYAKRLGEYILAHNLQNVFLVGHSFGGRIAIEYCSKNNIAGLILVDSAGIKPKFALKKSLAVLKYKLTKRLVKIGLVGKQVLDKFGSSDYKNASNEMKKVFLSAVNYNQLGLLGKIDVPTLIVWGNQDQETPLYMAKKLNKKINNSELVILSGGHFSFLDEPYKFYKVIDYFINKNMEKKL